MAVQVQGKRAAVDVDLCHKVHVVQQGQRAALRLLCGGQGFFKGAVRVLVPSTVSEAEAFAVFSETTLTLVRAASCDVETSASVSRSTKV